MTKKTKLRSLTREQVSQILVDVHAVRELAKKMHAETERQRKRADLAEAALFALRQDLKTFVRRVEDTQRRVAMLRKPQK